METIKERIQELCRNKGVTIQKLETELGYSNASIAKINTNVKAEKLKAIADYFNVSMEYLLTGQEPEVFWDGPADAPVFTIGELQLLEIFRQLNYNRQDELLQYGTFLLSRQNDERKKSSELSKEA